MEHRIIETGKMIVTLNKDSVFKHFKISYGFKKRFETEKKALQLLHDIEGIPKLIKFSDRTYYLEMTRVEGENVKLFSEDTLRALKSKMNKTIQYGVARHALPLRDVLVNAKGEVGIVDFERATIRQNTTWLIWLVAVWVTKFHTYRFIYRYNKVLLTKGEIIIVRTGTTFRSIFNGYKFIRNGVRDFYRNSFKVIPS